MVAPLAELAVTNSFKGDHVNMYIAKNLEAR